jgi:hypothetical protein
MIVVVPAAAAVVLATATVNLRIAVPLLHTVAAAVVAILALRSNCPHTALCTLMLVHYSCCCCASQAIVFYVAAAAAAV